MDRVKLVWIIDDILFNINIYIYIIHRKLYIMLILCNDVMYNDRITSTDSYIYSFC